MARYYMLYNEEPYMACDMNKVATLTLEEDDNGNYRVHAVMDPEADGSVKDIYSEPMVSPDAAQKRYDELLAGINEGDAVDEDIEATKPSIIYIERIHAEDAATDTTVDTDDANTIDTAALDSLLTDAIVTPSAAGTTDSGTDSVI